MVSMAISVWGWETVHEVKFNNHWSPDSLEQLLCTLDLLCCLLCKFTQLCHNDVTHNKRVLLQIYW